MRKTVTFHIFCSLLLLFACFDGTVKTTAKITGDKYIELVSVPDEGETFFVSPVTKSAKVFDRQNFRFAESFAEIFSFRNRLFTQNPVFIRIKDFDFYLPLSLNKYLTFLITKQTLA